MRRRGPGPGGSASRRRRRRRGRECPWGPLAGSLLAEGNGQEEREVKGVIGGGRGRRRFLSTSCKCPFSGPVEKGRIEGGG